MTQEKPSAKTHGGARSAKPSVVTITTTYCLGCLQWTRFPTRRSSNTVVHPLTANSLLRTLCLADSPYTDSCLNLSTTATSLQRPLFLEDIPYIDSCLNLSTEATSLQRPLSSVPMVAVMKRFNSTFIRWSVLQRRG